MTYTASFQTHPSGYWVVAEFSKGKLHLSHKHSLEEEFMLHKDNIAKGEYSKEEIEKTYEETEQVVKKCSGRRFQDEYECQNWLKSNLTDEDIYWEKN